MANNNPSLKSFLTLSSKEQAALIEKFNPAALRQLLRKRAIPRGVLVPLLKRAIEIRSPLAPVMFKELGSPERNQLINLSRNSSGNLLSLEDLFNYYLENEQGNNLADFLSLTEFTSSEANVIINRIFQSGHPELLTFLNDYPDEIIYGAIKNNDWEHFTPKKDDDLLLTAIDYHRTDMVKELLKFDFPEETLKKAYFLALTRDYHDITDLFTEGYSGKTILDLTQVVDIIVDIIYKGEPIRDFLLGQTVFCDQITLGRKLGSGVQGEVREGFFGSCKTRLAIKLFTRTHERISRKEIREIINERKYENYQQLVEEYILQIEEITGSIDPEVIYRYNKIYPKSPIDPNVALLIPNEEVEPLQPDGSYRNYSQIISEVIVGAILNKVSPHFIQTLGFTACDIKKYNFQIYYEQADLALKKVFDISERNIETLIFAFLHTFAITNKDLLLNHNDIHFGNILVSLTKNLVNYRQAKYIRYQVGRMYFKVPTEKYFLKLADFGFSETYGSVQIHQHVIKTGRYRRLNPEFSYGIKELFDLIGELRGYKFQASIIQKVSKYFFSEVPQRLKDLKRSINYKEIQEYQVRPIDEKALMELFPEWVLPTDGPLEPNEVYL